MEIFYSSKDLENRYDGPLPLDAACPVDSNLSWKQQCANRQDWALKEVRRIDEEINTLEKDDFLEDT
ncbi:MAG: hypothetical protein CMM52_12910 [Rhodospirillaceae bacterium]|nr:hypothetical protein [Rhodospirillaceae bacterium]